MTRKTVSVLLGYSWNENAIRNRLSPIIELFVKRDWNVEVFTSGPINGANLSKEKFIVSKQSFSKAKSFLIRAANEIFVSRQLSRDFYNTKSEVRIVSIPSMFFILFIRKTSAKQLLDVRDLTWEYLPNSGLKLIFKLIFKKILKYKIKNVDVILCSTAAELEYFQSLTEETGAKISVELLSNGLGQDQFLDFKTVAPSEFTREILHMTYIGNVGVAQNLKIVVDAIATVENIKLNIVGDGSDYANLVRHVKSTNNRHVEFFGAVAPDNIKYFVQSSDILIAHLSNNFRTAIPSKLYEYLSCNRPIIFGGCGQAIDFLEQFEGVKCFNSDSTLELIEILRNLDIQDLKRIDHVKNLERIERSYIREKNSEAVLQKIGIFDEK